MAIKAGHIAGGCFCMLFCLSLIAQQKNTTKTENGKDEATSQKAAPKKKSFKPGVYLGKENFAGGPISVASFNNILKQGLRSHDSSGNKYKIISFNFIYAERKLYEDSAGEMGIITDYSTEFCMNDTLPTDISENLDGRVKKGDTIIFDQVMVARLNATRSTDTFLGSSLKCVIMK